ncbi:MAG: D-aminoacyl-tRNA deacylase [Anaeroplasma sp.]
MRVIVQRVKTASCIVDNQLVSSINKGFLLFIGYSSNDTKENSDKILKKVIGLRIFEDENGKINKSLNDVNGEILAISQFTLYADCKHGNRPSFTQAMDYHQAEIQYHSFCDELSKSVPIVKKGVFGADMKISLINDGPVTIILDSDNL